jgi:hypothetical protein
VRADADAEFSMNPVAAVWDLAREFLRQQRTMADLERKTLALQAEPASGDLPAVHQLVDEMTKLRNTIRYTSLPSLAASFALALEVYDTFGPGTHTVTDVVEAVVWNKFFVARSEMTPPAERE